MIKTYQQPFGFATNSAVAVPKDPGVKPTPPEKPGVEKTYCDLA